MMACVDLTPVNPLLGRLQNVRPRDVWPHEALNFTPWLLGNVDVLSDLLGMDLVLEEAEHPVGGFSLDLKGYDESTGDTVIVENQLEQSDHTHLGQIITYAAGTEPTTIVWVATHFRPEHRAAIDWLNQRTDEETRFFGVVIKVVQIGDSIPAPAFELAVEPNDWRKTVKTATSTPSGDHTDAQRTYREFWETTLSTIRERHPDWTRAQTSRASWVDLSTGAGESAFSMNWVREQLTCQLYFSSRDPLKNERRFSALLARRNEFEAALGTRAEWDPMDGRKGSRIVLSSSFADIQSTDEWPAMADWLINSVVQFRAAVSAAGGIPA